MQIQYFLFLTTIPSKIPYYEKYKYKLHVTLPSLFIFSKDRRRGDSLLFLGSIGQSPLTNSSAGR